MIEAINSVVANSQMLRAYTEQAATSGVSVDIADSTRDITVPKAPYISPYISVDVNYNKAVMQIRDQDTGDVLTQYPSESRLQQIRRQSQLESSPIRVEPQTFQALEISEVGAGVPSVSPAAFEASGVPSGGSDLAQARIASAAFAAGAASTAQSASTVGVSVVA